jgi:hypothetical protein
MIDVASTPSASSGPREVVLARVEVVLSGAPVRLDPLGGARRRRTIPANVFRFDQSV